MPRRYRKEVSLIVLALALLLLQASFVVPGERLINSRFGGELVVGIAADVETFNPLFSESAMAQSIGHLLLLGLADLNERSEFVPELATRWEFSEDYLTLTYYLRKNAFWSDGRPITARDVQFTYELLMDSTVASPRQGVTEYLKRVVAVDSHTVRFEFKKAYPDQLFDTAGEVIPEHIFRQADRRTLRQHVFGRKPVSSGPFLLNKWISGQYIELVPNPLYYGRRPYLDRVVFKIVPDASALLMQLQTGEVDMMIGVPPSEAAVLQKKNPRIRIYRTSGRVYYYVGYNEANPLFASADVRRALTMAIDRDRLIQALLYGFGHPCTGPIPPIVAWAYHPDITPVPYDPQAARRLLAEQGWQDTDGDGWLDRNGQRFEFRLLSNTGNSLRADLAVVLQDQWRKIGVKADIQTLEWTAYLKQLRDPSLQAYLGGWSAPLNVDPYPLFHSRATDLFNYVNYRNPDVDRLIEQGRQIMDRDEARKIWRIFQETLYRDQPYTFLFWIDKVVAIHRKVKNAKPIALSPLYDLENWYIESPADRRTE